MRTLEGIDTLVKLTEKYMVGMLEDMRTLEGIDTYMHHKELQVLHQLEDMRTLEWGNCQANPAYIYEE